MVLNALRRFLTRRRLKREMLMANITVANQIKFPSRGIPRDMAVQISLISGSAYGGFSAGQEVLGIEAPVINGNGLWSKSLLPNIGAGGITDPVNTYYEVKETAGGRTSTYYIQVDGSGDALVWASDIIYSGVAPGGGSGGDVTFRLIDTAQVGHLRWPGDLMRMTDGKWLAVWERNTGAAMTTTGLKVFAAESVTTDPMGAWTEPWTLSNIGKPAVDPWLAQIGSEVFAGWQGGPSVGVAGFSYVKRSGLRSWSAPAQLFDETGSGNAILEGTVNVIRGTTWMNYNRKPTASDWLWTVTLRTITSNGSGVLSVGSPTDLVVQPDGPGTGYEGGQTRGTIADTGTTDGLIVVWSKDEGNGLDTSLPRDIWAIRSTNNGVSWGSPYKIAEQSGKDLVNPFAILRADTKLRVYFSIAPSTTPLGYVESSDGGVTFGSIVQQTPPTGDHVQAVRIIVKEYGGVLYAESNASAQTIVGLWRPS